MAGENQNLITPNRSRLGQIYVLSKARLSSLVLLTTAVGFVMASAGPIQWALLLWTVAGTAFTAAGANAFNQWFEVHPDSQMDRTRLRPLPQGEMSRSSAFLFGVLCTIAGGLVLGLKVNTMTAALGLINVALYAVVYTPLKTRSTLCTQLGAICGAIPPIMGWTAVTGTLDLEALVLGAVLFIWQIPHFLALAWLYKDEYAKAGFRMVTINDRTGKMTGRLVMVYTAALLPMGLIATATGLAGIWFAMGSMLLGGLFLITGMALYRKCSDTEARRVFRASLLYLPLLLTIMMLDRGSLKASAEVERQSARPIIQLNDTPSDVSKMPVENESRLSL